MLNLRDLQNKRNRLVIVTPMHGIGNRMLMICSGLRLANKLNSQLVLAWTNNDHPESERTHFFQSPEEMYETNIPQISYPPRGIAVYLPEQVMAARYVIDIEQIGYNHLYISEWTHVILTSEDLQADPYQITLELSDKLSFIKHPTALLTQYINDNYTSVIQGHKRILGVHIRKGAFVGSGDSTFKASNDVPISYYVALTVKLLETEKFDSVFLCAPTRDAAQEYCNSLEVNIKVPCHTHSLDKFPTLISKSYTNGENTYHSSMKMYADFTLLSNCSGIITTPNSTYAVAASISNRAPRFVLFDNGTYCQLDCKLFSGFGL